MLEPSRRNRVVADVKIPVSSQPDAAFDRRKTRSLVVPGRSVLRITTVCGPRFSLNAAPIWPATVSTARRSRLRGSVGVPTLMSETSVCSNGVLVVERRYQVAAADYVCYELRNAFLNIGLLPAFRRSTFSRETSTPTTSLPFRAKQAPLRFDISDAENADSHRSSRRHRSSLNWVPLSVVEDSTHGSRSDGSRASIGRCVIRCPVPTSALAVAFARNHFRGADPTPTVCDLPLHSCMFAPTNYTGRPRQLVPPGFPARARWRAHSYSLSTPEGLSGESQGIHRLGRHEGWRRSSICI